MLRVLWSICDCTDWNLMPLHDRRVLVMKPSWRTALARWPLVAVPLLLTGLMVWTLGYPPGSYRAGIQAQAQQKQLQQIANLEKQISRLSGVQTGPMTQNRAALQEQLDRARQKQSASAAAPQPTPTLGTIGDTLYWSVMGLMVLIAVAGPGLCLLERIELDATVPGELLVKRRWQVIPNKTYRIDEFATLDVMVSRVIRIRRNSNAIEDVGWRWRVMLHGPDTSARALLEIFAEMEPTLPTRVSRMTDRVRLVVAFLEEATGLVASEPMIADIDTVQQGVFSRMTKYRLSKPSR